MIEKNDFAVRPKRPSAVKGFAHGDADLLAKGRAFVIEAGPYAANFKDYGMPGTMIADLTAACDAFEATFATAASAQAYTQAATADTAPRSA